MKLYRPATILVGLLFVLIGGITRLAAPENVYEEQNLKIVHGTIGESLEYAGSGSTVKVNRIKFARSLLDSNDTDDKKAVETNGVFVAIEWDTVRGVQKPGGFDETLTTDGGSIYVPVEGVDSSDFGFPDAGFARTGTLVFEVNPADMTNLTLRIRPSLFFNVYSSEVRVDLGIPTDGIAQQMVDGAEPQYVVGKSETRVAS